MERWQLETAERLATIETDVRYIKENLSLPEIRKQLTDQQQDISELKKFREDVLKRIAWISGAFAVILAAVPHAISWIVEHFSISRVNGG